MLIRREDMEFIDWVNNKGLDVITKELNDLCEFDNITLEEGINFIVEFEDGSYLTCQDIDFGQIDDDFDSSMLLKEIGDELYNDYVELQHSMEFNNYQKEFIYKIKGD